MLACATLHVGSGVIQILKFRCCGASCSEGSILIESELVLYKLGEGGIDIVLYRAAGVNYRPLTVPQEPHLL